MKQEGLIAKTLAQKILGLAKRRGSEEDLRIGVEKLLEPALQGLGLKPDPSYERRVFRGRPDALHGFAIIEYEHPGKFDSPREVDSSANQVAGYIRDVVPGTRKGKEQNLRKWVGICLDGFQIQFVRYGKARARLDKPLRVKGFYRDGPYTVSPESIATFLYYLRSLRRFPLTPEALARDFGPKSEIAQSAVNAFYSQLLKSDSPRVAAFFDEWERIFGIVYGQELAKAEKDADELAEDYHVEGKVELKPLLFSVHTYFALLMKMLAAELMSLQEQSLLPTFVSDLPSLPDSELKERLRNLEEGGLFLTQFGIKNLLEGGFFGWYVDVWDEYIGESIRAMARAISSFEPATSELDPETTRDLLKKLYQYLVPKRLRHDLGEYYTPDWLAERLLNQVGYNGNLEKRLLDPACGSGTFLVLAIRRAREYALQKLVEPKDAAESILNNIVGFDLNPLAVIAARTNYLLALGQLRRYVRPIEIPVYMCDSILTPSRYSSQFPEKPKWKPSRPGEWEPPANFYIITTSQGDFQIPTELGDTTSMEKLASLLEECVANDYAPQEFLSRAEGDLPLASDSSRKRLRALYEKILGLEHGNKNRIWARWLKNAFAPIFAGEFDFVVGNPPWVNWQSIASEYRTATQQLWQTYKLFPHKGLRARLGSGKDDISVLMAYVAIDEYLKLKGKLGFVITQTVFKTSGGGEGFRRFQLGDREPLRVMHVDDMVHLQPFEGAANRTSVVVLRKGMPTKYPVPYALWRKKEGASLSVDSTLEEAKRQVRVIDLKAQPVDEDNPASPWVTARPKALQAMEKVIGVAAYQARAGSCTWANGIYWLRILEKRPDGLLLVENLHDVGRTKVKKVQAAIEPDLVYPLLRGRDVQRWRAKPSAHIVVPQDPEKPSKGYDPTEMKKHLPKTYAYLKNFEEHLRQRSGYKKYFDPKKDPFYSMYNIGPYTFARCKVVWPWISVGVRAAVILTTKGRPVCPEHNTSFVACDNESQANFICALLNSKVCDFSIRAFYSGGGGGIASPSVFEHIMLPEFDPSNPLHRRLSELSMQAHKLAAGRPCSSQAEGDKEKLAEVEEEIDQAAAELWGITDQELDEIKGSLCQLGR